MSDRSWTLFVRGWRDLMRTLFLPRCSRSEPCCDLDCPDVASHFARTQRLPDGLMWLLFYRCCWHCGALDPKACGCPVVHLHPSARG